MNATAASYIGSVRFPSVSRRARRCQQYEQHVIGRRYWSAYWQYEYEVIAKDESKVTVRELSTGSTWQHHTALDWRRDLVLLPVTLTSA